MDWHNQEVLNNPNLSYTSRDYSSIYNNLIEALPSLTKVYNPDEEADPGIVLIKVISMLGDMLSHVSDINALEVYPRTVLQTPNAQQIFRLVGYKMKYYTSARCAAYFNNENSIPITIQRYNTFTSAASNITYTNLNEIQIPAGASGSSQVRAELVQGTPVMPSINYVIDDTYYTGEWYDAYDFNVDVNSYVTSNRIYLSGVTVDGSTITLIDDDTSAFASHEWERVENLNTLTKVGKYFEFDFDETGSPYIQLPEYWSNRYIITRFKLFYVISDGADGEILANSLTTISPDNVIIPGATNKSTYLQNLRIYNSASTSGSDPETPDEARISAELYINTIDTLVTLDDFTKATKRIEGIANAIATDIQTDPNYELMTEDQINLYVIRLPGYENVYANDDNGNDYYYSRDNENDKLWAQAVVDDINNHKLAKYDIDVKFENYIDWIDWTIEGAIWLRQPVPTDKNHDIMVKIDNLISYTFSPKVLGFKEAINYIDVIDCIKSADKLIYHVDLNSSAIIYSRIRRDNNGNPTGETVKHKWLIYDETTNAYTQYYANGFGCLPTPSGDGTGRNAGYRIFREDGANFSTGGLNLETGYEVNEFEIYNNKIFNWVQEKRIDTGYYIDQTNPDRPVIMKTGLNGEPNTKTPYYFVEQVGIYLKNGDYSGEYLVTNNRDANGIAEGYEGFDETTSRPVFDIYSQEYGEWTKRFIDRAKGEIFVVRGKYAYSTKHFYNESTDQIVDSFGDPILQESSGDVIRDIVSQEELTGLYQQNLTISTNNKYDFYLGQDDKGEPLLDSQGNIITGFPISPDGFNIYVNTDEYIIHDNGNGILIGSPGILDGYGTIDYTTGHITFTTTFTPMSMRIMYQKNVVTMARYYSFNPDKFYTMPQFLRYENARRTLG